MKEYSMFVRHDRESVRLEVLTDCPLYDLKHGQCSSCNLFRGLDTRVFREGKCGAAGICKPMTEYCCTSKCPSQEERRKRTNCNQCGHFLGFRDNNSFYCTAKDLT